MIARRDFSFIEYPDHFFMTNYVSIGKLVATFGYKGEMVLQHNLGKKTALKGLDTIFIEERKNEFLPYFIEGVKVKSDDELFIKLEGYDSKESARKLLQKQVWLTEEVFHSHAEKSSPISLLGFHIIHEGKDLGEILEVIEQPHQLLCRIEMEGKEALIPVHQETLVKMDQKKKQVFVELPDGLLEIFLG